VVRHGAAAVRTPLRTFSALHRSGRRVAASWPERL